MSLGLDGTYRFGIDAASGERVGGRARWLGANGIELEIDTIARINHFTVLLDFEGDTLRGRVRERSGLIDAMPLSGRAMR